jgi:4-nitrophenyl phosphatase
MSSTSPGNVVCDLDGVVFLGSEAIPGAGAALAAVRDGGFRVLFATNAATRTAAAAADRIHRVSGFPASAEQVVTSGMAAAAMIRRRDQPLLVAGEQGLVDTMREAGIEVTTDPARAGCVVVGLDRGFDYQRLHAASAAARNGARLIATNTDPTFPTPEGPAPGAGSLVAAVETASGRSAEPAGKPHDPMAQAVAERLGPGPTWMVGDRPETDLALAAGRGWIRVLVLSGVTNDPAGIPDELGPDHVLPDLAALPALLADQSP